MLNASDTIYKKATQALNFLARKKDGKINKMKAVKIIYFADRLHLRKYGRPIVGDVYWAMKYGPVGSMTDHVADFSHVPEEVLAYAKKYIKPADDKRQAFISLKEEDLNVFSETDIECLEAAYDKFSDKDQFELAEITHQYPEWAKHKRQLATGTKRIKMDYNDFFENPSHEDGFFAEDKSSLSAARESFTEMKEVSAFFAK